MGCKLEGGIQYPDNLLNDIRKSFKESPILTTLGVVGLCWAASNLPTACELVKFGQELLKCGNKGPEYTWMTRFSTYANTVANVAAFVGAVCVLTDEREYSKTSVD